MLSTRSGRWLLVAVLTVVVLYGTGATAIFWRIDAAVTSLDRSDDIAACRAAYAVELISAPQSKGLEAVANNDRELLAEAVEESDPAEYERLVDLSQEDPEAFLRLPKCRTP